jgi:hypothetical protein
MKHLKIYEEFESSSDFNKRVDYVRNLINEIKDILIPFIDNGCRLNDAFLYDNNYLDSMIANILYSKNYLVTYNDFYKSVMSKDLKSLSDLFCVFISNIERHLMFVNQRHYKLPDWILDCLYHLESYMISEGFKLVIKLYYVYDNSNDETTDFNSVSDLEKFESNRIIRSIRIGFDI